MVGALKEKESSPQSAGQSFGSSEHYLMGGTDELPTDRFVLKMLPPS